MNGNYRIGDRVFGNWVILSEIGKGSFGKVYVVGHEDDQTITAALKVITVPQDEQEVRNAANEGMDYAELSQHFYDMVQEIENEFKLQFKVKGSGHVVAYEDHKVEPHRDQFGRDLLGWDILIRMELLTPLLTWAYEHPMTRGDIIRLGIHLCKALEACQVHDILHRDIKPENIFVSATGDYKLGDFGVARTMEKTVSNMSKKGTYNYMAPEVYKGDDCNFKAEINFKADIYSVGIVLYRLLNRNRFPFLPAAPQPVTMRDREQALARRMKGERLPLPIYAQDRLGEIVCKAANYDPAGRYASAAEMRRELEETLRFERDDRTIYPDAEDLRKRQDVDRMSRTVNPSATPRMSDRTVHLNQFDNTGWGDNTVDDTADKTSSGWGARGGFASQDRTESNQAYFRTNATSQQTATEEPEEMTSSTVSAWSHRTPSGRAATEEDRREAAAEEANIAMQKAKSGAMGEAFGAARKASKEAMKAAKLARENRPARNEKEALEFYEKARKERDAKTAERQTLENMTGMDANLKADMMRDAAKAEMEAVAKENAAKKVWEEFRQKRLDEEEAKRQEELKRQQEAACAEAERKRKEAEAERQRQEKKRKAEEETRQREIKKRQEEAARQRQWEAEENLRRMNRASEETRKQKASQTVSAPNKTKNTSGNTLLKIVAGLGIAAVIGLVGMSVLSGGGKAKEAVAIAEKNWDMLYDALDVEGELNYRTSSLEEIGAVLDTAGFQFRNQEYDLVDEIFIDESNGRSLHAQQETWISEVEIKDFEVIVSEGDWGYRTVIFRGDMDDFYSRQAQGEIPAFLPTEFVLGTTTTADFGIDEDMIRWIQRENDTTVGDWDVFTYGDTSSYGEGECSLILTNEKEKKELNLRFFITPGTDDYVLQEIWIQFPEDPTVTWTNVLENLHQNLYQSMDMTEQSGINYQTDSLEDIVTKLEENGASFYIPEGSESKIYEVSNDAVPVSNREFEAGFPEYESLIMRDEYYDEVTTRMVHASANGYERYTANAHLLPVSYLIPGKTTMEDVGITEEMLDAVKEADGGSGASGFGCYYGDLRVYQCEYKKKDGWYIHITKTDPQAEYEVGEDYVDITMYFRLTEDQLVLDYWYYSFAMEQVISDEIAAE